MSLGLHKLQLTTIVKLLAKFPPVSPVYNSLVLLLFLAIEVFLHTFLMDTAMNLQVAPCVARRAISLKWTGIFAEVKALFRNLEGTVWCTQLLPLLLCIYISIFHLLPGITTPTWHEDKDTQL